MHEDKFEKQVRGKMDQLGFDPPDDVWTQIDHEINKEKERRRSIFWIFLLSGFILASGATYLVIHNFVPDKKTKLNSQHIVVKNQDVLQKENILIEEKRPVEKIQKNQKPGQTDYLLASTETVIQVKGVKGETDKGKAPENKSELKSDDLSQAPFMAGGSAENAISKEKPKVLPVIGENAKKKVSADSPSVVNTTKKKDKESKKSPWVIVFTGSAGASNVNQALFQPLNAASLNYTTYFPTNGSSVPVAVNHIQSGTTPGFSFALGVSVQRNLLKRISGSIGLGYHYYSTRIHAGIRVNSALNAYTSLGQATPVNAYFTNSNGEVYTNQFHFIELPVNLSFQLNKSRKNPLNWEGGFSLNWLVSSNALHYDPYNNVYFENNNLLNKLQWDVQTAVLLGFPVRDHSIQLGPQIQYGLTSLLKNSSSYPGHLIYYGLKFSFTP